LSGIKDEHVARFYRKLHFRGETADTLAAEIVSGRSHVTEVLNGTTDSPRTRRRLARLLEPEELELLGWDGQGQIVPRATKSEDRHLPAGCSTR
jgi:hypothetical protein